MPILTGVEETASGRRIFRLPGLPDFNSDSYEYVVEEIDGWDDGPSPVAVLVDNGGGPGMVAVDPWLPTAAYYTLVGSIEAEPQDLPQLRRLLLAALTPDMDAALVGIDESGEGQQAFVRVYDRRDIEILGRVLRFTVPLVAPDPFKYGLEQLAASAGGFGVADWFRTYEVDAGDHYRTYDDLDADHYRAYDEDEGDASALPTVASLTSPGDAESSRMTITVTGPVTAGEWYVEDAAGTRLWAELSLIAGQSITFDCRTRTATLSGAPVDHLTFGDYLRLAPGENAYRLIVGASGAGSYMSVEALAAFQ